MIGPTIVNISALLGLLPHGDYFGPEYSLDSEFTYPEVEVKGKSKTRKTKYILAYNTWLLYFKGKGEVTDDEHVAFLIYWLDKLIFCNSLVVITKEHTNLALALALAEGKPIPLAPIVWSLLVRGLHDYFLSNFRSNPSGPLWLIQLWLLSYFPNFRPPTKQDAYIPTFAYHFADLDQ